MSLISNLAAKVCGNSSPPQGTNRGLRKAVSRRPVGDLQLGAGLAFGPNLKPAKAGLQQ